MTDPGRPPACSSAPSPILGRLAVVAAATCLTAACSGPAPASRTSLPDSTREALVALRDRHDYFRLRDRLAARPDAEGAWATLLRAEVASAFGREAASDSALDRLERRRRRGRPVPDTVLFQAGLLRYRNDMRLYRFGEVLEDVRTLLASPLADSSTLADRGIASDLPFVRVLRDVPAQTVEERRGAVLRPEAGAIPVTIDGKEKSYFFDSGADFSVLMETEARDLGLRIQPTGGTVGSSTDLRVQSAVAVADRVEVGGAVLRHVVFLVLPDSSLTFPGKTIPGILGFPILRALGAVGFGHDGTIRIQADPPPTRGGTMALDEYALYAPVVLGPDTLACHLDTGSGITVLFEPFYRSHRKWADSVGRPDTVRVGGAGGIRRLPVVRIPATSLEVAGSAARVDSLDIYTSVLRPGSRDECLVGRDVLGQFGEYVLDFTDMALVLRKAADSVQESRG